MELQYPCCYNMKVLDVLKYFLKNEYLTSTCTWYIFGYLVYLSTWSTVLDPNPGLETHWCVLVAFLKIRFLICRHVWCSRKVAY